MKRFNNKHIIILFIVILDQLTKLFIRENFSLYQSKPVTSFLSLTYIHNTGMAWGFFQNKAYSNIVFIFIMIAILACFAIYQKKLIEFGGKAAGFAITLIFAGAFGNLIDRILYGFVIDFVDFRVWPVFNIADSAISISITLIIILLWKE